MLNGKKVKINVERLMVNHNGLKFRQFIEKHKDDVFTAIIYGNYKQMYILLEDDANIKWLFFEDDLIEVEE